MKETESHHISSFQLHNTSGVGRPGSFCGGSCRWCTGWWQGRCSHCVLRNESDVPSYQWNRCSKFNMSDYKETVTMFKDCKTKQSGLVEKQHSCVQDWLSGTIKDNTF